LQTSLLNCVRKFMREQVTTSRRIWRILARAENNILTHRVGVSIYCACGFGCLRVIVNSHAAEIVAESVPHEGPRLGVERMPGRAEHAVNNRRNISDGRVIGRTSLNRQVVIAALAAFAA
jgi:hypothetical protein